MFREPFYFHGHQMSLIHHLVMLRLRYRLSILARWSFYVADPTVEDSLLDCLRDLDVGTETW